ncbi:hypothetical protein NQ294_33235, partial [Escherichia coli]|nr:hypothetical protein [Escherichia coli]
MPAGIELIAGSGGEERSLRETRNGRRRLFGAHRGIAAIHRVVGARHEARRVAAQERHDLRDLRRIADPAEQVKRRGDAVG